MLATIEQANTLFSGRNPYFWNFVNDNYSNEEWNTAAAEYNTLESQVDGGSIEGIAPAPNRPFPPTRP